jgi:hypothetical protein
VAPVLASAWDGLRTRLVRGVALLMGLTGIAAVAGLAILVRNEPRLLPEAWVPMAALAAGTVALLLAVRRGAGRLAVVALLGAMLASQAGTAFGLPGASRLRPVPRLARRIRMEQSASAPEPVALFRVKLHSPVFYLGRRTHVVSNGRQVDALTPVPAGSRAFVLSWADLVETLEAEAPRLTFRELDRAPNLVFRFENSILGRAPTTRDLVLLEARRRGEGPTDGTAGAPGGGEPPDPGDEEDR